MGVVPEAPELGNVHPDAGAVGAVVVEHPGDGEFLGAAGRRQGDDAAFFQVKGLGQGFGDDHLAGCGRFWKFREFPRASGSFPSGIPL